MLFHVYIINAENPNHTAQVMYGAATCQGCDFSKSIAFQGKAIQGRNLRGSNLTQANASYAILSGNQLQYTNFTKAILNKTQFASSLLMGAIFQNAYAVEANFNSTNLGCSQKANGIPPAQGQLNEMCPYKSGANLQGADLRGARFMFTNLQGADFTDAQTDGALFYGADLTNTILRTKGTPGKTNLGIYQATNKCCCTITNHPEICSLSIQKPTLNMRPGHNVYIASNPNYCPQETMATCHNTSNLPLAGTDTIIYTPYTPLSA